MKRKLIDKFRGGFVTGVGIAAGLLTTGLLAVTVSGAWHAFAPGDIISSSKINDNFNSLKAAVESVNEVPVGAIVAWPGNARPEGWLECDGSPVSRSAYADLFGVIGTMYGEGDGSTTFNLPDYRGYFLRGWDRGAGRDPDAGDRLPRGDGTPGNAVGTVQNDAFQGHWHEVTDSLGNYTLFNNQWQPGTDDALQSWGTAHPNRYIARDIVEGSDGVPRTASETRSANIYAMYIIKY